MGANVLVRNLSMCSVTPIYSGRSPLLFCEVKIMKRLTILFITLSAAVLASCASVGEGAPKVDNMLQEMTGQNGRACVRQGDIRGFGVLDNNVVSIDGTKKYYLATVLPGCHDLQMSMRAAFKGGFGEVCGQTTNKIVTNGDHCVIRHMFEFENREAAHAMYNSILEERKNLKNTRAY